MTVTRHTGAPHTRQDTLIGMRNCLEFLCQEAKTQELNLTQWLLRMAIASLDEELPGAKARPDVVPAPPQADEKAVAAGTGRASADQPASDKAVRDPQGQRRKAPHRPRSAAD